MSSLDAKTLVDKFGSRILTLPNQGEKINDKGPSYDPKESDHRLESIMNIISEPRINQFGQLSQANWVPELKKAKVLKPCGKIWRHVGHSLNSELLLHPEEALFMLESNQLILKLGDVPMSIQSAYEMLLNNSECDLNEYLVYQHLSRLGYKVMRFQGDLTSKVNQTKNTGDKSKPQTWNQWGDWSFTENPWKDGNKKKAVVKKSNWAEFKNNHSPKIAQKRKLEVNPLHNSEGKVKVSNGLDLTLSNGPLKDLWRGKTKPMIQPQQAMSTEMILNSLQLGKKSMGKFLTGQNSAFKFKFDLYKPETKFVKSNPTPPDFRLIIISDVCQSFPNLEEIRSLLDLEKLRDKIPILICIVGTSKNVSFYHICEIDLPQIVSMG